VLRALGELGVDLDTAMSGGFTPAIVAASNNHVEALEALHVSRPRVRAGRA
jgi:ankyrin repeat protein